MFRIRAVCGVLALLVCGLSPATAQSVRGHLKTLVPAGEVIVNEVSIDAWIDDDGEPQGMMEWTGGLAVKGHPAGPSDPWHLDILDLEFDGNAVLVTAIVTHSVFPDEIGTIVQVLFTDNSGTGEPDEFGSVPAIAGHVTVSD
jgi:hypothetical protein